MGPGVYAKHFVPFLGDAQNGALLLLYSTYERERVRRRLYLSVCHLRD